MAPPVCNRDRGPGADRSVDQLTGSSTRRLPRWRIDCFSRYSPKQHGSSATTPSPITSAPIVRWSPTSTPKSLMIGAITLIVVYNRYIDCAPSATRSAARQAAAGQQRVGNSGQRVGNSGAWFETRDTSCCCHPLNGVPHLRFGPRRAGAHGPVRDLLGRQPRVVRAPYHEVHRTEPHLAVAARNQRDVMQGVD